MLQLVTETLAATDLTAGAGETHCKPLQLVPNEQGMAVMEDGKAEMRIQATN